MKRLRWAGGIMIFLGAGHLSLLMLISWDDLTGWLDRGLWAAVPLDLAGSGTDLRNEVTFWAGPGSFAVPLVLLGCMVWHLAGRGVAVPAWLGWAVAVWSAIGGVLLVPSPYFAGVVAGALVIAAARNTTTIATGHSESSTTSSTPEPSARE